MAMAVWQWRDGNGEMAMASGPDGRFDGAVSVGERAADTSGVPLAELRGCAPCGFQTKPILVPASRNTLITVVRLFVWPPLCTRWSTVETTVQLPAAPARPSREYPPRYSSAVITVPIRGSLVHGQHVRLVLLVVLVGFINFQWYHTTVPLALVC